MLTIAQKSVFSAIHPDIVMHDKPILSRLPLSMKAKHDTFCVPMFYTLFRDYLDPMNVFNRSDKMRIQEFV